MPDLTPETWAHIRAAYEHSDRPVADICAEHGISTGTLRDRVRRWRWTRRRAPVPREGPPAVMTPVEMTTPDEQFALPPLEKGRSPAEAAGEGGRVGIDASAATIDPHPIPPLSKGRECAVAEPAEIDPAAIAARLQGAVGRVLPAIEATIAKLAAGPQAPREMEQTARALGTMMRTLRELNALLAQQPPRAALNDDDMPEDIDAFRFELARRIRAFVADRAARGNAAAAEAALDDDDDIPADIDAFREKLAQKIEAFMESRGDEDFEEDEPADP